MIAGRPTVYRNIQMRSRLEARTAALLDYVNIPWRYEPRAYKSRAGEYLPDFEFGRAGWLLEVKPALPPGSPESMNQQAYLNRATDIVIDTFGHDRLFTLFSNGLVIFPESVAPVYGYLRICENRHLLFCLTRPRSCGICGAQSESAKHWLAAS